MSDASPFINGTPVGKSCQTAGIRIAKRRITKARYDQLQRDRRNPTKRKRKEV